MNGVLRVERHEVAPHRVAGALADFDKRLDAAVDAEQEGGQVSTGWSIITNMLLDYVGAWSVTDPELSGVGVRRALSSAAATAVGAVEVVARAEHDRVHVHVPYTGTGVRYGPGPRSTESLSPVDLVTGWKLAWICRVPSFIPLAEAISALPLPAPGDPVDHRLRLAQAEAMDHDQLMRPDEGAAELDRALTRTDGADPVLVAELNAFRALLARDRDAFQQWLVETLCRYRGAVRETDPRPGSLLPLGPLSLACLAADDLGWDLDVASDYIPRVLLTRDWNLV